MRRTNHTCGSDRKTSIVPSCESWNAPRLSTRCANLFSSGQVAPPGGRQPKDIGIKKAARALGLTREEVRRAKAIAGIIAEAKAQARELGLDEIRMPFFRSQSCRRTLSAQQLLQLSRLSVPHAPALRQELLPPQMGNRQPRSRLSKTTKQQIRKEHHRLRRLARTVKWSGRNCA